MKRIFCSLDELLDTRLGFIALHYPDIAEKYVNPNNDIYYKRVSDNDLYKDLGITNIEWNDKWKRRDSTVLKNSIRTYIPECINSILTEYYSLTEHALDDLQVTMTINTYPYSLSEIEKNELSNILEDLTPLVSSIDYTAISLDRLTPKLIKQNYDYVFMYEFNNWLYKHSDGVKEIMMADCHFFVPRIMIMTPEEDWFEDKELKEFIKLDPFKILEGILSPKIGITFIAGSDFSAILRPPVTKQKEYGDLDWKQSQSGSYTPRTFQYDPRFQFHPE